MGTTKKVKYMVANGTDYDMYAFETTSDQIKEGVLTTESQLSNGTDTQLVSAKLIRDVLNKKANQADISNWAKQPTKPKYTASEVGAIPDTTKIPSKTSDLQNDRGFLTESQVNNLIDEKLTGVETLLGGGF